MLSRSTRRIAVSFFFCLAARTAMLPGIVNAQTPKTIGKIESMSDRMSEVLPLGTPIEVLAGGFTWTEGPLWVPGKPSSPDEGHLLFSDIPRNTIFRWDESNGVTEFMKPSGYTGVAYYGLEPGSNGLALAPRNSYLGGRLCMCEHGDRRVSMLSDGGGKQTLVDAYQGKRLNSPNDLVFAKDGTMYFTDPPYGLPDRADDPRRELDFCGVYRLDVDGTLTLLSRAIGRPNGIGLSPDESRLIVAQSDPDHPTWTTFSIHADGTVGSGKEIASAKKFMDQYPGLPDGLCVARDGTIFASGPGGIYVMDWDGHLLGRITTQRKTSNCTLSPDESTLYITADDVVCRVRLK